MRRTEQKEINGVTYEARQMSAYDAAKYWPRLMKFLGEDFLALMTQAGAEELLNDPETSRLIFRALIERSQENEMGNLLDIVRACEVCLIEEGKKIEAHKDLDTYFSNPFDCIMVAVWAGALSFRKPSSGLR